MSGGGYEQGTGIPEGRDGYIRGWVYQRAGGTPQGGYIRGHQVGIPKGRGWVYQTMGVGIPKGREWCTRGGG